MGDFDALEEKTAEFLKKSDFSRISKGHKEKLWQTLGASRAPRRLADDELDLIAAAGAPQPLIKQLPKEAEEPFLDVAKS